MTDAWFGSDIPRWLALLSMLSLLAIPVEQGRWKSTMISLWVTIVTLAGVLIAGAATAVVLGQPAHVVRTLTLLGIVFGVSFGATFPAVRRAYQKAELRKTVAADL